METPARFRLYQYPMSPYCIPVELLLRHSGLLFEVVNLPYGDPTSIIELTKGDYYQVPVLEDLFNRRLIYDRSAEGDDVPRFLAEQAPLMNLFPEKVAGLQRILIHYIENDCEAIGFKINDAHGDKWLRNDLERGRHRRHKERKFGAGCLAEWRRDVDALTEKFYRAIWPFEQMLGLHPFLTGDRPVYADYALCGVLGNFLFSGATSLPGNFLMLEAWYTKMCAGNFSNPLDDFKMSDVAHADEAATSPGADLSDVEKNVADLKLRPGSAVLEVATGRGDVALFLAAKGYTVTAADVSVPLLKEAADRAAQQKLAVTLHEHGSDRLPYPDGSFHLVICRGAGHHMAAPETFVREATRVLRTYGFLVVLDGTLPDDHVEANAWMNAVERLRDPSHAQFITPNTWRHWCVQAGLTVTRSLIEPERQPDLNRYFAQANTPPENRKKVLELVAKAPSTARELFKIGQEDGRIVWTLRKITLIAGKM